MKRYAILYLATLMVIATLFCVSWHRRQGLVHRRRSTTCWARSDRQPAILFYLLYVAGILVFVSGPAAATWPSTLAYGALFGLFCYATFDLTALSLLKHWTWPVAAVDVSPGARS